MKIERIDQPGTELNTDEENGGLGTDKNDSLHSGRTSIDLNLVSIQVSIP